MTIRLVGAHSEAGNGVVSKTYSQIVAGGYNRMLIVSVVNHATSHVTSVTYAGVGLTKLIDSGSSWPIVSFWYLLDPPAGTDNIVVTCAASDYFSIGSAVLYGVHQTTPYGGYSAFSGASTPAATLLTSVMDGSLIFDVVGSGSNILVADVSQTNYWEMYFTLSHYHAGGSYKAGSGSVATSWTVSTPWVALAIEIISDGELPRTDVDNSPVFDRTLADITNRTPIAFFNISDLKRIYGSCWLANIAASVFLGSSITFDTLPDYQTTQFISAADLNKLIGNIERVRLAISPYISGMPALKTTWLEGNVNSPTFVDVNLWEKTISDILNYFTKRHLRSGLSISGAGMTRNNKWRH